MASEVSVELRLVPPAWELSLEGALVLPLATTVSELSAIVNSSLSVGAPREDWAFRIAGHRVLFDLASAVQNLPKFSTETTAVLEVFIPVAFSASDSAATPDALVKLMVDGEQLVCLGARGNVTLLQKEDLKAGRKVIHSDEPNSVDLIPLAHAEDPSKYWMVTSCGVILSVDVANETIDVEGKIDTAERFTAAALSKDGTLIVLGDAEGNLFMYDLRACSKRSRAAAERCHGSFNWVLSVPTLVKTRLFTNSISYVDLLEGPKFCVLVTSLDGGVKVVDTIDGSVLNVFNTGKPVTACLRFSEYLITGHVDGRYKIWQHSELGDQTKGRLSIICVSQLHARAITGIAVHSSFHGRTLVATTSNDRRLCFADISDGKLEASFELLAEDDKTSPFADIGPVGDYGVYPTALLIQGNSCFVGTNNQRVHRVLLE